MSQSRKIHFQAKSQTLQGKLPVKVDGHETVLLSKIKQDKEKGYATITLQITTKQLSPNEDTRAEVLDSLASLTAQSYDAGVKFIQDWIQANTVEILPEDLEPKAEDGPIIAAIMNGGEQPKVNGEAPNAKAKAKPRKRKAGAGGGSVPVGVKAGG